MNKETPPLSEKAQNFKLGTYKHYKGEVCKTLGVGRNSENISEEFVVYQSLEKGLIWIRPLDMFMENVNLDGKIIPRFEYIGE
jgi:hypothetical protein